jgi:outer membrane receptor for ferrienterochelin and colicins
MRSYHAPIAALALIVASGAFAQTAPGVPATPAGTRAPAASKPPVRALGSVDVVGATPADDRRDATTTRIVVLHDEIVRYGDTALSDVLNRLPGVSVEGAAQGTSGIRLRGLGNGYTQILLDGEPAPAGFDLDSLSPALIERIEILRAPTAELGTQSIAGTINIVLRKAVTKAERSVKLRSALEHARPGYGVDANVGDRDARGSYLVAVSASSEKHDRSTFAQQHGLDAEGNTTLLWLTQRRNTPRVDRAAIAPRVTWNAGDSDILTSESLLRYRGVSTRAAERTTSKGIPPAFGSDRLDDRYGTTAATTRLRWIHRWPEGSQLDSNVGLAYTKGNGDAAFTGFDANDVFILDRRVQSATTDQGLTFAGKYLTPLFEGHALALGWDDGYTRRSDRRLQLDRTPSGDVLADIDEHYRVRLSRLALYAQDEWDVTDSWSTYWGLRWEHFDTDTTGNTIGEVGNRSDVLSPLLQMLWKSQATKGDQMRLGISRTYKAPRPSDLSPRRYIANNNTATTPDFRGNPDLRPELAWGVDAAYEHYFSKSGLASVSAYARRIDDVVVDRLVNVGGIWVSSPANSGNARVYGIEAEVKLGLRDFRKEAPDVSLHANLARNWSTVDAVPGPDNRLDRQRAFSANAGFDYVLDAWPLTLGANFTYRGSAPVRLSLTQSEDLPVRRVLDFHALWKLNSTTRLRLSLANVLAQQSVAAMRYFDENGMLQLTTTTPTYTTVRVAVELTL